MAIDRTEAKLLLTFEDRSLLDKARLILSALEVLKDKPIYEQVLIGVLQLSAGSLSRLRYFVDRAREHPGDIVIIMAQHPDFVFDDIDEVLGGGPLELSIPRELLRCDSDDLWARGSSAPLACVVCGRLVSADFVANPHIILRRTEPVWQELAVPVHRKCMAVGRQRAEEQGYLWLREQPVGRDRQEGRSASIPRLTKSDALANRVEGQLRMTFNGVDEIVAARAILKRLDILRREAIYKEVLLGVLQISGASLDSLRYFTERARQYPTDIMRIVTHGPALLPDQQDRLEQLLSGGRLERSIPPELLRKSDDLWSGEYLWDLGLPVHCVVCGEVVSQDVSANPQVIMRRSDQDGDVEIRVTAHPHCMALGRQRATEQGTSWEEVP